MTPCVWELPTSPSSTWVLVFLLTQELRNELCTMERGIIPSLTACDPF